MKNIRREIRIAGTVQGVGFRPFVVRLGGEIGIAGEVRNTGEGVMLVIEGEAAKVQEFMRRLSSEAPPLARITSIEASETIPIGLEGFQIVESELAARPRALIPPDSALCDDCGADIANPHDRRYRYPFTNCTNCGPRFTIVTGIPYDRPKTTMTRFEMCDECAREYRDPTDRRFHAEPIACPNCGPKVHINMRSSTISYNSNRGSDSTEAPGQAKLTSDIEEVLEGDTAMSETARLLRAGRVVALKGLGGFHLACDARNENAVETLRNRKGRGEKPFAVMVRDIEEAKRIAEVSETAENLLRSPESPVVIMPVREGGGLADGIAPRQNTVGVMLPYTPLHRLLLAEAPPALVMTSGNLAEEPIVYTEEEAAHKLRPLADVILWHNRPIAVGCDDSVVRVERETTIPVRRARGYVPRSVRVSANGPPTLAVGGYHKNTFCLLREGEAIISQHIGDLDTVEALEYFGRAVRHFERLFEMAPEVVAHDLHPGYLSTQWAQSLKGVRLVGVQHHHAHVVSVMAEAGLEGEVLGVSYDGSGYGDDGTVWGGELLKCNRRAFTREGHLRGVSMPGGEAAVRRPGRMALSYLVDAFGPEEGLEKAVRLMEGLSEAEARVVARQLERAVNSPMCSSMGRLFDVVAVLLGATLEPTYEGQPAMELEAMAAGYRGESLLLPYRYDIEQSVIDARLVIKGVVADLERGVDRAEIAARFHETVAAFTVDLCRRLGEHFGLREVALSGGVMQNARLVQRLLQGLKEVGLQGHIHKEVPPNDGGMSLGQALIGQILASD